MGVISGILTSIILFLISAFIKNTAIPWYRQIIYRGIDINGEWISRKENPSGNIQENLMTIIQKADKVECIMNISKRVKDSDEIEIKIFKLTGVIQDRFLSIYGKNTDKKALGFHSELLEVVGNGKVMQGCCSWYSSTNKTVQSVNIEWIRK